MSFESFNAEAWIYSTLKNDSTLQTELAKAAGKAKDYQIGVYGYIAPSIDPNSNKTPVLPYIIFDKSGNESSDELAVCGSSALTFPVYRIKVWDGGSKALNFKSVKAIADRVDVLLSNQVVTSYTPNFNCIRNNIDTIIQVEDDGKIYYAAVLEYRIVNRF